MNSNGKAPGYSNFFSSGMDFRRLSGSSNGVSVIPPAALNLDVASFSDAPRSTKFRRSPSMFITLPRHPDRWHIRSQSRRLSLTFLSRLFKRKSKNISKEESGWLSSNSSNASILSDIWTMESDTDVSACKSVDNVESKSFLIGIEDTPFMTSKHGASFLSISSTPSPSLDTSFIRLPRRNRRRPVSIQTMPLPSMVSCGHTNPRHSMPNFENTLTNIKTAEPIVMIEEEAVSGVENPPEEDVPAMICWREFHTELLAAMT